MVDKDKTDTKPDRSDYFLAQPEDFIFHSKKDKKGN